MRCVLFLSTANTQCRYRAPKNTRGRSDADEASFGFLDGDLLERLLACAPSDITQVFAGEEGLTEPLPFVYEEMHRVLEMIQDMH